MTCSIHGLSCHACFEAQRQSIQPVTWRRRHRLDSSQGLRFLLCPTLETNKSNIFLYVQNSGKYNLNYTAVTTCSAFSKFCDCKGCPCCDVWGPSLKTGNEDKWAADNRWSGFCKTKASFYKQRNDLNWIRDLCHTGAVLYQLITMTIRWQSLCSVL